MTARYIVGDVRKAIAAMPDASVDLVLTSPPFLALRSYLPADHPDKAQEIGSELTPAEFIDTLLDITDDLGRVLTQYGSAVIELGDTYSGSGGAGGDYTNGGLRDGQAKFSGSAAKRRKNGEGDNSRPSRARSNRPKYNPGDGGPIRDRAADEETGIVPARKRDKNPPPGWPLDKSLCMIPELLRVALSYGRHPLTGRECAQWRCRNVIRWCRPNPPVGDLADKFRPGTSDMLVICKDRRRWFDLDAVRTPLTEPDRVFAPTHVVRNPTLGWEDDDEPFVQNEAGAPPLDHWWIDDDVFEQDAWLVSTQPYAGSHYATWPEKLLTRPIDAMCPLEVCTTCGEPRRRITKKASGGTGFTRSRSAPRGRPSTSTDPLHDGNPSETVGWTDCGHDTWRRGVVLDLFAGSGTTLRVAEGRGRDSIGIDLDERNAELARERVGMFLTVETLS